MSPDSRNVSTRKSKKTNNPQIKVQFFFEYSTFLPHTIQSSWTQGTELHIAVLNRRELFGRLFGTVCIQRTCLEEGGTGGTWGLTGQQGFTGLFLGVWPSPGRLQPKSTVHMAPSPPDAGIWDGDYAPFNFCNSSKMLLPTRIRCWAAKTKPTAPQMSFIFVRFWQRNFKSFCEATVS